MLFKAIINTFILFLCRGLRVFYVGFVMVMAHELVRLFFKIKCARVPFSFRLLSLFFAQGSPRSKTRVNVGATSHIYLVTLVKTCSCCDCSASRFALSSNKGSPRSKTRVNVGATSHIYLVTLVKTCSCCDNNNKQKEKQQHQKRRNNDKTTTNTNQRNNNKTLTISFV